MFATPLNHPVFLYCTLPLTWGQHHRPMAAEPTSKRQRLSRQPASDDFLATFLPTPVAESHPQIGTFGTDIDPFCPRLQAGDLTIT